ncbi:MULTISPECIES: hypothetical protein [Salinibaculum]|uniref:hypothetical protein n=1 Tax=Salinibaculum TaxID=2732368 RepID=UPI0030D302DF
MTSESISEQLTLPSDVSLHADTGVLDPRADPAFAGVSLTDRIVSINDSNNVVVFVPWLNFPSIETGVRQFIDISQFKRKQTVAEIESCLNTAHSMLEPSPRGSSWYGVLHGRVQLSSNTPSRFITDLREIEARAREFEQKVSGFRASVPGQPESECLGSILWPTKYGWFYLNALRPRADSRFFVRFGLLRIGTLLDPTPVSAFFEQTTEEPPMSQDPWPFRQLILSSNRSGPVVNSESVGDAIMLPIGPDFSPRLRYGDNPLLGVSPTHLGNLSESAARSLYRPLQLFSGVVYDRNGQPDSADHVERLVVLDPPSRRTLYVTASLKQVGF